VLRYARATGRKCEDVAADLVGVLIPVASEHMAAIVEPVRIGGLLRSPESPPIRSCAAYCPISRRDSTIARITMVERHSVLEAGAVVPKVAIQRLCPICPAHVPRSQGC
jgi:hypothetical protein